MNIVNIKYHYNSHSFNIMVTVVSQATNEYNGYDIDTTLQGFGVLALLIICVYGAYSQT
ncbi:MAG: hypothetical protein WKF36_08230 [Candidatus Nitrosocosmicus sp.]